MVDLGWGRPEIEKGARAIDQLNQSFSFSFVFSSMILNSIC